MNWKARLFVKRELKRDGLFQSTTEKCVSKNASAEMRREKCFAGLLCWSLHVASQQCHSPLFQLGARPLASRFTDFRYLIAALAVRLPLLVTPTPGVVPVG